MKHLGFILDPTEKKQKPTWWMTVLDAESSVAFEWTASLRALLQLELIDEADVAWIALQTPQWSIASFLLLVLSALLKQGETATTWEKIAAYGDARSKWQLHGAILCKAAEAPKSEKGWRAWGEVSQLQKNQPWIMTSEGWVGLRDHAEREQKIFEKLRSQISNDDLRAAEKDGFSLQSSWDRLMLCGGPGTGKSTWIGRWIQSVLQEDPSAALGIQLSAPTARAVQRLVQLIAPYRGALPGYAWLPPPSTLHRLLQRRGDEALSIPHAEGAALPLSCLVVDEASMVDTALWLEILRRMPQGARLLMVGDGDQLPSIEVGGLMQTLTQLHHEKSKKEVVSDGAYLYMGAPCPMVELTRTYRFQAKSALGGAAEATKRGDIKALMHHLESGDGSLTWHESSSWDLDAMAELYTPYFQALQDPDLSLEQLASIFEQARVLTAGHQGPWGTQALNGRLVEMAGSIDRSLVSQGFLMRGLPLMVLQNLPQLGLVNGEIGFLLPLPSSAIAQRERFSERNSLLAEWEVGFLQQGNIHRVPAETLLTFKTSLAWATTVHKAQGSEFERLLLILPERGPILSRGWLYTGITRAKVELKLVASRSMLEKTLRQADLPGHFFGRL